MRRMWAWMLVCLVVGGAVGYGIVSWTSGSPRPQQEQSEVGSAKDEDSLPKEERERRDLRLAVLGHNAEILRLEPSDDGWIVHFSQEADAPDLNETLERVHAVFTQLSRTRVEIQEAAALIYTSIYKDVYGHTIEDLPILRARLDKETFEAIDWAGFEPVHLERVAEEFWLNEILHAQYELLKRALIREELGLPPEEGGAAQGGAQGGS